MADKSIKILLADDSAFMRKVLMNILSEAGYSNFVECEDGQQCIDTFNAEQPGLMILDIIMPNLTGVEVLKQIGGKANAIIISAVGQEQMVAEAKQNGAMEYIVKPFDKQDVVEKVDTVVKNIVQ